MSLVNGFEIVVFIIVAITINTIVSTITLLSINIVTKDPSQGSEIIN